MKGKHRKRSVLRREAAQRRAAEAASTALDLETRELERVQREAGERDRLMEQIAALEAEVERLTGGQRRALEDEVRTLRAERAEKKVTAGHAVRRRGSNDARIDAAGLKSIEGLEQLLSDAGDHAVVATIGVHASGLDLEGIKRIQRARGIRS